MAGSDPRWKQTFDRLDRALGPRVNEIMRSDEVASLMALAQRGRRELEQRSEQASRRALHWFNLPAGSDVNRLLTEIAHLEREVRDLRKQLADRDRDRDREPARREPAKREPTKRQPTKREPTNREPTNRDQTKGDGRGTTARRGSRAGQGQA